MASPGQTDAAMEVIAEHEFSRPEPGSWCSAELLKRKAEIQHQLGSYPESGQPFLAAVELAQRQGALSWELSAARAFVEVTRQAGATSAMTETLTLVLRSQGALPTGKAVTVDRLQTWFASTTVSGAIRNQPGYEALADGAWLHDAVPHQLAR